MASGCPSWSIVLSFLLLLLFLEATSVWKEWTHREYKEDNNHMPISIHKEPYQILDPSMYMFFTLDDLNKVTKTPIYFSKNDPSTIPPLLPREEADSIPFSTSNLTFLLNHFSVREDSPQSKAMAETLDRCELKAVEGEVKFCATSLESMLDSVRETLGFHTRVRVLTTKLNRNSYPLQNYVFKTSKELLGCKMLGCHRMPYPYTVYYCHGHKSGVRVFEVTLIGETDGEKVTGPAACHLDTSTWDADHVAFKVLGMEPRSAPVCHFFPLDNLMWVNM